MQNNVMLRLLLRYGRSPSGGREGATLALVLGAVFAATGGGMSVLRLIATPRSGD